MKGSFKIAIVLTFGVLTASASTDDVAKRRIELAMYEDEWPWRSDRLLQSALGVCNNDTNRFTRLLQEVATENTNIASFVISKIGRFGTATNLPFLYGCVTNVATGRAAIMAVFRIEGVTTNSIDRLDSFVSNSRMDWEDQMFCGCWVLKSGLISQTPQPTRRYLLDCIIREEERVKRHVRGIDEVLIRFDPVFRYSKRRLAILRGANAMTDITAYQRNYVTNAINELIAYPESNLND